MIVDGTVVAVHVGEIDHEGRRPQLALVPYALSQGSRLRQGVAGLAGNSTEPHVHLQAMDSADFFVAQGSGTPGEGYVVEATQRHL